MGIKTVKIDGAEMRVEWGNGEVDNFSIDELSPEMQLRCMLHGLSQKTMDVHAGGIGKHGSIEGCRAVSLDVWEMLKDGEWTAGRESGGYVVEALADVLDVSLADAREVWDECDDDKKKAIRKDAKIVAWKAERDLNRARLQSAKGDGESILDTL